MKATEQFVHEGTSSSAGAAERPVEVLRKPVSLRRLEHIDGMRALAAIWVAIHHAFETSVPIQGLRLPVIGPLLATISFGQFPVMVFLMLSGFCLYYPCVRKNPDSPQFTGGYLPYLVRRATRIAPPYLWAGLFCMVLACFPQVQVGRWKNVASTNGWVIVSHLLLVHNLIPSHSAKIDYPMWSIGLEWQLYLIFPLLVWAFRRVTARYVLLALLFVAMVVRGTYRHLPLWLAAIFRDGPFSYLEILAAGMLVAWLTVKGRSVAPRWVLTGVVITGAATVRLGAGNGLVHDLATTSAAFCALLLAVDPKSAVSRVLTAPPLVEIGLFSYSFYLVHAPLLQLCWLVLRPLHLSDDATFYALCSIGLPLILVAAYGFHLCFEKPFMRSVPARVA